MLPREVKLLRHRGRIDGILTGEFKPPVMVDIDPVNGTCNLDCAWCCQAASRAATPTKFMSVDTMTGLGRFCREWGVKAWRISSDSEPLLNKNIEVLIESGAVNGIDMGLITNGVYLERVLDSVGSLHWLGVSLDATTRETWSKLKRSAPENFDKIIANVKAVRRKWPDLDMSIKFLRWSPSKNSTTAAFGGGALPQVVDDRSQDPDNFADAERLTELADSLGVRSILKDAYPSNYADTYRFTQCLATPLGGVFGADHRFHLCCDARSIFILTDDYTRDGWQELPKLWGSEKHRELIASINPKKCAGCAKAGLNETLQHLAVETLDGRLQSNFI